jgi:hypothetical protein
LGVVELNEYGNNFGSLRKYMQRKGTPFIWPGSKAQWNGISDDRCKILAKHFISGQPLHLKHQAFNVVNGDIFRWSWLWKQVENTLELNIKALWNNSNVASYTTMKNLEKHN